MAKKERRPTDENAQELAARSFEEVLHRLEEIVEQLEAGEQPVEQSLALFEEGVRLAREGHRRLEAAERRIATLLEEGGERPLRAPVSDENDEGEDDDAGEPDAD